MASLYSACDGQPNWSYSFRKMIMPLVEAGFRVIVPDIVGFGRSDKPTKRSDYTFARHVAWLRHFIKGLDLKNINLIAQDWGGPIALRNVTDMPERFARILVTNTGLGDGTGIPKERTTELRRLLDETPALPLRRLLSGPSALKMVDRAFFIGSSTVMLMRTLILER